MSAAVKVILIIVACFVLLGVLAVGAGIYWWTQYGSEYVRSAGQERQNGTVFGRRTNQEGCLAEAISRYKQSPGFSGAVGTRLFLDGCLENARPSPGFCDGVPGQTEFRRAAQWQQERCAQAGITGDSFCPQLFTQVQIFCATSDSRPPQSNANRTP